MLKKLLFAGGMAYLIKKFTGGSRRSSEYAPAGGRRRGLRW